MDNKNKNMQKYIDDMTEWQDNQYNPGYFIGGITPNNLLTPRKPRIIGWLLILISISSFVGFGFLLFDYLQEKPLLLIEHFYYIAQLVLMGGFSLLLLIGGILKIQKKPVNK